MIPLHLSPKMTHAARLRAVKARLGELGYTLEVGDHPTRSITWPISRRIVLRAGAKIEPSLLPLLVHELAHAERQGRSLTARLWWGFCYLGGGILGALIFLVALVGFFFSSSFALLLPLGAALILWSDRFRGREEIEGEAHEAVMRALLEGAPPRASHRLGNLQAPYLLIGDPGDFSELILIRSDELLGL